MARGRDWSLAYNLYHVWDIHNWALLGRLYLTSGGSVQRGTSRTSYLRMSDEEVINALEAMLIENFANNTVGARELWSQMHHYISDIHRIGLDLAFGRYERRIAGGVPINIGDSSTLSFSETVSLVSFLCNSHIGHLVSERYLHPEWRFQRVGCWFTHIGVCPPPLHPTVSSMTLTILKDVRFSEEFQLLESVLERVDSVCVWTWKYQMRESLSK